MGGEISKDPWYARKGIEQALGNIDSQGFVCDDKQLRELGKKCTGLFGKIKNRMTLTDAQRKEAYIIVGKSRWENYLKTHLESLPNTDLRAYINMLFSDQKLLNKNQFEKVIVDPVCSTIGGNIQCDKEHAEKIFLGVYKKLLERSDNPGKLIFYSAKKLIDEFFKGSVDPQLTKKSDQEIVNAICAGSIKTPEKLQAPPQENKIVVTEKPKVSREEKIKQNNIKIIQEEIKKTHEELQELQDQIKSVEKFLEKKNNKEVKEKELETASHERSQITDQLKILNKKIQDHGTLEARFLEKYDTYLNLEESKKTAKPKKTLEIQNQMNELETSYKICRDAKKALESLRKELQKLGENGKEAIEKQEKLQKEVNQLSQELENDPLAEELRAPDILWRLDGICRSKDQQIKRLQESLVKCK